MLCCSAWSPQVKPTIDVGVCSSSEPWSIEWCDANSKRNVITTSCRSRYPLATTRLVRIHGVAVQRIWPGARRRFLVLGWCRALFRAQEREEILAPNVVNHCGYLTLTICRECAASIRRSLVFVGSRCVSECVCFGYSCRC